jgi:hypothetical protein
VTKKSTRQVRVGVEVSATLPGTWRLYAECRDETTSMILMGRQPFTLPKTENELLSSGLAERLLADHQQRCFACQRWAAP